MLDLVGFGFSLFLQNSFYTGLPLPVFGQLRLSSTLFLLDVITMGPTLLIHSHARLGLPVLLSDFSHLGFLLSTRGFK